MTTLTPTRLHVNVVIQMKATDYQLALQGVRLHKPTDVAPREIYLLDHKFMLKYGQMMILFEISSSSLYLEVLNDN